MVAIPFNNKTKKTKFQGTFTLESIAYNYTLYLLPIKKQLTQKQSLEIIKYFGNRLFKGKTCLDIDEAAVEENLIYGEVSAFIMVHPVGVDNIASGTLQIYNWCNPTNSSKSSQSSNSSKSSQSSNSSKSPNSPNISNADVWINDVCRVSPSGNQGNPLRGLFFFMEQLVVQNLGKPNIKLYIDPEPTNKGVLKPKYTDLGFTLNSEDDPDICPGWTDHDIVMEKTGLSSDKNIIDFSFLDSSAYSKTSYKTTAKGISKKRQYRKHKKTYRKHK